MSGLIYYYDSTGDFNETSVAQPLEDSAYDYSFNFETAKGGILHVAAKEGAAYTNNVITSAGLYNKNSLVEGADINPGVSYYYGQTYLNPYITFAPISISPNTPYTFNITGLIGSDSFSELGGEMDIISAVPLPAALPLLGAALSGLTGLGLRKSRRNKAA